MVTHIESTIRRIVSRILLLFLGCIAAVIIGEMVVRIYLSLPPPKNSVYIRDADTGFRIRPHFGVGEFGEDNYINEFGFRDQEHPIKKNPRSIRIIGIGDSFVYGSVGRKDHFLKVTEKHLSEAVSEDSLNIEMVMMGLGGYGPENYVGVLRSIGLSLDPDLVILNFFIGNDITGIPIRGEVLRGKVYYTGSHNPWLHLARKSRLFILFENAYLTKIKRWIITRKQRRRVVISSRKENQPSGSLLTYSEDISPLSSRYISMQEKRLPIYRKEPSLRINKLWKKAEDCLMEFNLLCREAGISWILFIIPAEVQVDPIVREQVIDILQQSYDDYDFNAPQRRLKAFAEKEGIHVIDPLAEMREVHNSGQRLYIPNDSHWNVIGNRIAGKILVTRILQLQGIYNEEDVLGVWQLNIDGGTSEP